MSDLEYGPLQSGDIASIQAMIQGTSCYCSVDFNTSSQIGFTARHHGRLVGFMSGRRGYGDESSMITLSTPFLYHAFQSAAHEQDMQLAFINWAAEKRGITHYRANDFEAPHPIGIRHLMPSDSYEIPQAAAPVLEEDVVYTAPPELAYA